MYSLLTLALFVKLLFVNALENDNRTFCDKFCKCGSFFGEKPFAVCRGVPAESIDKMIREIPKDVEKIEIQDSYMNESLHVKGHFPHLKSLSIRMCWIKTIDRTLEIFTSNNSRHLYSLSIDSNYISYLNKNTFLNFTSLEHLNINNNQIQALQNGVFSSQKKLRVIKLNGNDLMNLPKDLFEHNSALNSIYLEHNEFKAIPVNSLCNLPSLHLLDISYNQIKEIDNDLSKLTSLRFLYLTDNRIEAVHPLAFHNLSRLSVLWLRNNRLKTLPDEMGIRFYKLDFRNIILEGNPWNCNCQNRWLVAWYNENCVGKETNCSLICNSPSTTLMSEIDISTLRCKCHEKCYCASPSSSSCQVNCSMNSAMGEDVLQCQACSNESIALYTGATECYCKPGYTRKADKCEACYEGTYKAEIGPHKCSNCPLYSTSKRGSTSANNCICEHGEYKILTELGRKCQKFENEELVRLGLETMEAVPSPLVKKPSQHKEDTRVSVTSILLYVSIGVITLVVVASAGFIIRKCRHRLTPERMPLKDKTVSFKQSASTTTYHEQHGSVTYSTKIENNYKGIKVTAKHLRLGRLIGQGAFGLVYEGEIRKPNRSFQSRMRVAVKILKESASAEEKEAIQMELDQMIYIGNHPNIVELLGVCSTNGSLMLVLEYASNGDLLTYLKKLRTRNAVYTSQQMEENTLKDVLRNFIMFSWHVSKGMCHLEKLKCIHRDLAARNILLTADPIAKISDFGLSRDVYESAYYFKVSKGRLPFKWMSPEALLMGQYSIKSDVWSFGILMWEMVTIGGSPYSGIPVATLCKMYEEKYRLPKPNGCPQFMYSLMLDCWSEKTCDRPSFSEIESRLDTFLQNFSNREYTELIDNVQDVYEDNRHDYMTMPSISDTNSSDQTFNESTDLNSSNSNGISDTCHITQSNNVISVNQMPVTKDKICQNPLYEPFYI